MLAAIKADLKLRILAIKPKVDSESTQALDIGDIIEYEHELRAELSQSSQSFLPRRRQHSDVVEPLDDLLEASSTVLSNNGEDEG